jgi:hypothetical protein
MLSMVNKHQQEPDSPVVPAVPTSSPAQGPMPVPPPLVLPETPPSRPPPLLRMPGRHHMPRRSQPGQGRPVPPLNLNECEGGGDSSSLNTKERTARRRLFSRPRHHQQQHRQHHQRNDPPPPSPRFVSPQTPCPTALEAFSISFYNMRHVIWRVIHEHIAAGSTECFLTVPLSLLRAGVLRVFVQRGYHVTPIHPVKTTLHYTMPLIMYRIGWDFASE